MHLSRYRRSGLILAATVLVTSATAQSNANPNRDIGLERLGGLSTYMRGPAPFPSGVSAFGIGTTACNPGTDPIPFQPVMDPQHCFIHYILARESGGRLVQISDRSWVKHTFGSSNDPSTCGTCANPGLSPILEPGCNDAYAAFQAVDSYNLGPPDEIDPWLGTWTPACSYFDRGDPPVPLAQQCDGIRSFDSNQANALNNGLNHQPRVLDADLDVPVASFWYQAGYLAPAEPEAHRGNNIASLPFAPSWNGGGWSMNGGFQQTPGLLGSVLQRWTGATVTSAANQSGANPPDDGRFYVAVKVTGPTNGLFHYEYAVHNRDNKRGLGAFRVPICPSAQVLNFGFHDIDQDPLNQWSGAVVGAEIQFTTANNPLRWNSIFNFWFDCDAAPVTASTLLLDQFDSGAGLPSVAVVSTAPLGLYNVNLGPGCSSATAPRLFASGTPARATLGNATFGLTTTGNLAGATIDLFASAADGTTLTGACGVYLGPDFSSLFYLATATANGAGSATFLLPVPNDPAAEGFHANFQAAEVRAGGAVGGVVDLSNGLRVRVGNAISTCP